MRHREHPLRALGIVLAFAAAPTFAQRPPPPQPSPGLAPNQALGKPLYDKNCAVCHGQTLAGSDKGPPFLHFVYVPAHHGDASFQMAVKYGSRAHHWKFGDMQPLPGLSPDDVAHITAYVRSVQRRAGIE